MHLKLFHYWRSSCSFRVRMALAFKNISVNYVAVNLLTGEQTVTEHLVRNPSGLVPTLQVTEDDKTFFLTQSLAIMEWLEDVFPQKPLLPKDQLDKAHVRALAQIIACDTQPIQNLRVMNFHSQDQTERVQWAKHWIELGLTAYEKSCAAHAGKYSFGDAVTMADLCLVPQCYNAGRFAVDLDAYPTVNRIYTAMIQAPFCQSAAPDKFEPPPSP